MKKFPLFALADALLEAISRADGAPLADELASALIRYVSQYERRADVRMLVEALSRKGIPFDRTLLRDFAERILGTDSTDPDLTTGLFEVAEDYFAEPPEIGYVTPPVATNPYAPLPFNELPGAKTFEHLCYEFIAGSPPDGGVYLYGRSGHAQEGIDFLVLPDRTLGHWRRSFYECKQYVEFTQADLEEAVKKFENGLHAHDARDFTIIAASKGLSPSVIQVIDREHMRLQAEYGIRLAVWDATKFTMHLRIRRDLIGRYFGAWHQRAFPQARSSIVADGVQQYDGFGDEIFPMDLFVDETSASIRARNAQVHISIDLPHVYTDSQSLTGALTFRMLDKMQVGLGPDDLVNLLDQAGATDLEDRSFIRGVVEPGQKTTTLQIGNCRFYSTVRTAELLCEALDACNEALTNKLREYDRFNETEGLQLVRHPSIRKAMYRLGTIDELLWQCVIDAATDPNFLTPSGASLWALADRLRIFTGVEAAGAQSYVDLFMVPDRSYPHVINVLWQSTPPGIETGFTSGWWGAYSAALWLKEELVPKVVAHRREKAAIAWQKRPPWYWPFGSPPPIIVPGSPMHMSQSRYVARLLEKADDVRGLLPPVNLLQTYFTVSNRTWDAESRRRIITVLLIAIRRSTFSDGNTSYVRTKLFDATSQLDQTGIALTLEGMLSSNIPIESAEADYYMRALGEMLDKASCSMLNGEIREVAELLEPFAQRHDDELRLRLHTAKELGD